MAKITFLNLVYTKYKKSGKVKYEAIVSYESDLIRIYEAETYEKLPLTVRKFISNSNVEKIDTFHLDSEYSNYISEYFTEPKLPPNKDSLYMDWLKGVISK